MMSFVSFQVVTSYAAFTNHAFVLRETIQVATLLREGASWDDVRSSILHDNLLSLRALSSRKTMVGALKKRLQHAPECLLEHLSSGDLELQTYSNLFLILVQHALLRDFIEDVILEHRNRLVYSFSHNAIRAWFERKHQLEPSLETWTPATVNQARLNLIAICLEGHLLSKTPETAHSSINSHNSNYAIQKNFIPAVLKRDLQALGFAAYLTLMLDANL